MRADQFEDFKEDVQAGLSVELLSEIYGLTPEETKRGVEYVNRGVLTKLYTWLVQFFTKIVFQVQMKIRMSKIRQILKLVKRGD
ncbi:unnamed protein product, partial [marine sediment metagenome]